MFWKVGPELCDIEGVIAALDWNDEVRVHHKVEKFQPSEGDGFSGFTWWIGLRRQDAGVRVLKTGGVLVLAPSDASQGGVRYLELSWGQ